MSCRRHTKNTGHICEKAVSRTKHEIGRSLCEEESLKTLEKHAFSMFSLS